MSNTRNFSQACSRLSRMAASSSTDMKEAGIGMLAGSCQCWVTNLRPALTPEHRGLDPALPPESGSSSGSADGTSPATGTGSGHSPSGIAAAHQDAKNGRCQSLVARLHSRDRDSLPAMKPAQPPDRSCLPQLEGPNPLLHPLFSRMILLWTLRLARRPVG